MLFPLFPISTPAPIGITMPASIVSLESSPSIAQFGQIAKLDFPLNEFKEINEKSANKDSGPVKTVSLAKSKAEKPLVLFFFSEQCGVTFSYKRRLQQIVKDFGSRGVDFIGVRAGRKEKPDEPLDLAEPKYLKIPYLDDATGEATSYFNIGQSLTFVVLDKAGKMRYRGGFDDNINEKRVVKTYLRTALRELIADKPITVREGRVLGCAILPIKTEAGK